MSILVKQSTLGFCWMFHFSPPQLRFISGWDSAGSREGICEDFCSCLVSFSSPTPTHLAVTLGSSRVAVVQSQSWDKGMWGKKDLTRWSRGSWCGDSASGLVEFSLLNSWDTFCGFCRDFFIRNIQMVPCMGRALFLTLPLQVLPSDSGSNGYLQHLFGLFKPNGFSFYDTHMV